MRIPSTSTGQGRRPRHRHTGSHPPDDIQLGALTGDIIALHHRHELHLDGEVPYAVKLYGTDDRSTRQRTSPGSDPPEEPALDSPRDLVPQPRSGQYLAHRTLYGEVVTGAGEEPDTDCRRD